MHGVNSMFHEANVRDIKNPVVLAGCKVIGLLSKLVSAPLWRILEEEGHVMDLSPTYQIVLDYFERSSNDATHFMQGKGPFDNSYTTFDGVSQKLISEDSETIQCLTISRSQARFLHFIFCWKGWCPTIWKGCNFHSPSDEVISESQSNVPHDKIPECAFGQLDFLTRYRPNATALINESFLMFALIKKKQWLEFMPQDEKLKLLSMVVWV